MRYFNVTILLALVLFSLPSIGQGNDVVEMADVLRQDGKIYTVVFGLVIILTAMIILLIRVDRKIFRIEQDLKRDK